MTQLRTAAQMASNAASLQRQVIDIFDVATRQADINIHQSLTKDCFTVLTDLQRSNCQVTTPQQALTTLIIKSDLIMRSNLHPNKNLPLVVCIDASPHPLHRQHDNELLERFVSSQYPDAEFTTEVRRRHHERMYSSEATLSLLA